MTIDEALAAAGVTASSLMEADARMLDAQGYVILRGAVAPDVLERLRERFEACVLAADRWPGPRERSRRHAMLDNDAETRSFCLSPQMLAAVARVIPHRFFLTAVQGRDPLPAGGYQALHRDWPDDDPDSHMVSALVFLDPFGPHNGATRLVPATHRDAGAMHGLGDPDGNHPAQIVVEGQAGDVLVFHGRLAHSGMRNMTGAPRRSLLACYTSHAAYAQRPETRELAALPALDRYLLGAD